MENDCEVIEFLYLFTQIIDRDVKPVIQSVLNHQQPQTTGNDFYFQQAADFPLPVTDSPRLSAIQCQWLWICVMFGH